MKDAYIGIAIGMFLGNWLAAPALLHDSSYREGFWMGIIAVSIFISLSFFSDMYIQGKIRSFRGDARCQEVREFTSV